MAFDVRLVLLLFSIANLAACHRQARSFDQSLRVFQSLNKFSYRSWLQRWSGTVGKLGNAIKDSERKEWVALTEKRTGSKWKPKTPTKSSILSDDEDSNVSHVLFSALRQYTMVTTMNFKSDATTTTDAPIETSTTTTETNTTTDVLPNTLTYTALALAAVAVAVAIAVPTSLQSSTSNVRNNQNPTQQINFESLLSSVSSVGNLAPINNLPLPVNGIDFQDDVCGDGSVRFDDGNCYPVLRGGPCPDPFQWVTVDPNQLRRKCTPRLCGRGRVFVGRDGLCHDVNDPNECQGGRRLYYTAYGDPICDCPIGQYPFPNIGDDCVPLFTKGPCPARQVITISPEGRLGCTPAECQSIDGGDKSLQLVPTEDGVCYPLGSRGPCSTTSQLLGYDIFERRIQCVNTQNISSPYFFSSQENELADSVYNQIHPEYDDLRVFLIGQSLVQRNDTAQRKQDTNTIGVFQIPSSLPDPILHPCRPGARRGLNYKCTNPLVPNSNARELLQVVRSVFSCPANSFLQATGRCVNDERTTSCGPSYRFNQATRQCRPIFN